ncbi:arabinose efflux permease family protein [Pseudomonas sp. GM49]|jgi:predicted MFS family arabinose efflux permease|uniref:MFS transporter n=1 Tax=Pseudomonas sp. GM49 TaxID=1144331 RepID=UPI000270C0BE|nr:MFS transporter [Pseudomonas sp. GM49]EJM70003.1 arabinose efflux permease family protein [Pseudomonas sp. GM49]
MSTENQHYQATKLQQFAALLLPCYAYIAMLGIPMSFSGIIDGFTVSAATATAATTAEIICISIASLFVSLVLSHLRPRTTIVIGVVLAIVGQALTIQTTEFYNVVFYRGITGIGEGLCIAIGLASLAQMNGGTRLLSYASGLTAALTLAAFLAVPSLQATIGPKAMFWFMLVGAVICLPLAFALPNKKIDRLIENSSIGNAFNIRSVSLFVLCLLTSIGANTCWLYFEQVGESAGLDLAQVGVVGSVSMLCSILVPVAANLVFNRVKSVLPLLVACLLMAVTSYLYVVPNASVYWTIGITMTFLYVFLIAYARMYSADFDSSGRSTAAVGGADSLGMVIGPVLAAVTLNLDAGFRPLGDFGVVMQLLCIVPALFIFMAYRSKTRPQASH